MRQGNGSELLGMNDPRSQSIGIIYVSPNDDRKSVLAAILTQEKLGCKQVAVVLPTQQNRAFQRPVDFDDLKSIRRKLQTQIIFIAPPGPGPAEFARQRRFTVYSSLESYKRALQEERELPGGEKRGLFGRARTLKGGAALSTDQAANGRKQPTAADSSAPARSRQPQEEEEEEDSAPSVAPFVVGGVAGAAAAGAIDEMATRKPAADLPSTEGNTGVFSLPDDDYDDEGDVLAPPASSSSASSQASMLPPAARQKQEAGDNVQTTEDADDEEAGPLPIELPVRRVRTTVQLDPKTLDTPAPARASKKRNSSVLTAGAVGVAAGAAGAASLASQRAASGANPPPTRHAPGGSGPGGPRRRRGRGWLIALLLLLLTLLVVGGVMAYFPGTRDILTHTLPGGQPAATVSITPANQLLADSYVITGVPTNPDPTRLQISARTLTKTDQQQKTVTATGHNLTKGAAAAGRLTFSNGSFSPFTVAAGTSFKKANGITIVTDTSLTIPAAVPGGTTGNASVAAHATTAGTAGNLPAQAISGSCCTTGNSVFVVNNTAFSGGQDPKDYQFVQQSDVDAVVTPLKQPLVQQTWGEVQKQVASGEQMMNGAQCVSSFTTDQPVGDRGVNVTQATVTLAVKCTASVYNRQQMLDLVKGQLQKKADVNLGNNYVLAGNIQTIIRPQTSQDGLMSFVVNAKGVWVYQFSDAQKQGLAKQIAGKSVKDAIALLQRQNGVYKVLSSGGNTLPTDPGQIVIQVQSIPGLPASTAPPAVTPTVVNSSAVPPAVTPTVVQVPY